MNAHLRRSWIRISYNPVWAGVLAMLIGAAALALVDAADVFLTKKSPPAPIERAELTGGTSGPSRVLYRCMPSGQCVAPEHVVFDSIVNDPVAGNETYFMEAKVLGSAGPFRETATVKIGDTVVVRALIENDAAMNGRNERSLVARGTRFSVSIPTNSSSELPLIGHIAASNAVPRSVYDGVFLHADRRFTIEYIWGSAQLSNHLHRGLPLSDNIVAEGVPVGSGKPDGIFPPGLSKDAAVFLLVRILPASD
jgi:hypothetical protein